LFVNYRFNAVCVKPSRKHRITNVKIKSAKRIRGTIKLPGDKSISHRAAIFSAMATGEIKIENFSTAADCASTLNCLENLGVETRREGSTVFIKGVGKTGFQKPVKELDCGNSGTTMRLLAGVLAGQRFDSILIGDESLTKRPMKRIIEPLEMMGATIESANSCAPLRISGKSPLNSIIYDLPVASAQVKSCVLLAGLNSDGITAVLEKTPTRDHTEKMLRWFKTEVEENQNENGKLISVSGDAKLKANDLQIPSDISSAAFFLVAAACVSNSEIVLQTIGLNSTRAAIIEVLRNFGANIDILNKREICNEPVGNLRVVGNKNFLPQVSSNVLRGEIIANLIDEIPIIAVFGTQIAGGLEVRDAAELRVKESDRIAAVVGNLRKMGAGVEEFPDGFRVEKSNLKGAAVESFGDHRIAMAFAVAALFATGETEIIGAEAAEVSFPEFFQILSRIVE
jgi:3-phosphoshikimate 1-carboxyvinyltransferase